MLRKLAFIACLVFLFSPDSTGQVAGEVEVLIAYPMYFNKKEVGITSDGFDYGFGFGGLYFNQESPIVAGIRFSHFSGKDTAIIDASDRNYQHIDLHGTAKLKFTSIVPQIGFKFVSEEHPLVTPGFTFGMGVSWARAEYDLPTYDSLTMHYFNPPWNMSGAFNEERKLVAIRPCMYLGFQVYYEFRYFYAFGNLGLTYSMGEFPPSPVSLSAGAIIPLPGNY